MMPPLRLLVSLKAVDQLGPGPLALYALYRIGLRTGHYRRAENTELARTKNFSSLHPLFSLPSRAQFLKVLGKDGLASMLKEADEIVRGKVRLFGGKPIPLQLTFKQPLRHWSDYELHPELLANLYSLLSDPKYLWEPARFGWAFTLGRAFHATQQEKYAEMFWRYFEDFDNCNEPYLGPHWMNGQEVAMRLMALVWAAQVLESAKASTAERRAILIQSIAQHAVRIPPTLVYARAQNNNHLVTESAALFTAGLALDHAPWRELGWHWLNDAFQHQISSYGEYIQHSANYHRLMLQTALWVHSILPGGRGEWPASTLQVLARASHWHFSMLDPVSGRLPNLGANDGALLLPLSLTPFDDHRPTVQAAARAFLHTGLPAGAWDELSLWLGLPANKHTADSRAYMADQLRGVDSWGYLRATQFRSRLSHMDQLHFDLWWRGMNIAQDAGTYLYNAAPPWDNPLVFTRVHNTVTVDGRDQMTRAGRFLTLDWFPAFSETRLERNDRLLGSMLAYHKGYQRFGVRHERMARVFRDGHWEISDNLIVIRPAEHVYRLHWLLPDWDWKLETDEQSAAFRLKSPRGWLTLALHTEPALPDLHSMVSIVRAGKVLHGERDVQPFEGWASPTYGIKVPALSVALEVRSAWGLTLISEFSLPRRVRSNP